MKTTIVAMLLAVMACGGTEAPPLLDALAVVRGPGSGGPPAGPGYCLSYDCSCFVNGVAAPVAVESCNAPLGDTHLLAACASLNPTATCMCGQAQAACQPGVPSR